MPDDALLPAESADMPDDALLPAESADMSANAPIRPTPTGNPSTIGR